MIYLKISRAELILLNKMMSGLKKKIFPSKINSKISRQLLKIMKNNEITPKLNKYQAKNFQ